MTRGRYSEYDPEYHPKSFIELSEKGKSLAQIANHWKVCRDTLWRWSKLFPDFSDAVRIGREAREAWYTEIGMSAMLGQAKTKDGKKIKVEFKYFKWMTQNVCKWSERVYNDNPTPTTSKKDDDDLIEIPLNGSEAPTED